MEWPSTQQNRCRRMARRVRFKRVVKFPHRGAVASFERGGVGSSRRDPGSATPSRTEERNGPEIVAAAQASRESRLARPRSLRNGGVPPPGCLPASSCWRRSRSFGSEWSAARWCSSGAARSDTRWPARYSRTHSDIHSWCWRRATMFHEALSCERSGEPHGFWSAE